MDKYLPVLAGLGVACIFGLSFMFTKEALEVTGPFHLLAFRFTLAALFLSLLKLTGLIRLEIKGKNLGLLLLLVIFQPGIYFLCETLGIEKTTSSEAGMVIALIPVFVAIFSRIFLNENPRLPQWLFIMVSVAGVIFIIFMKGRLEMGGSLAGVFFLLGAVFSAAFYNILSRKLSLEFKPVELTYFMMWFGAIIFNFITVIRLVRTGKLASYFSPLTNSSSLISILYLGLFSSVGAFFLVNFMLSRMEAARSAVFTNLTTVISILAGVLVRGEPFYWFQVVGAILILLGVWGANYYSPEGRPVSREGSIA